MNLIQVDFFMYKVMHGTYAGRITQPDRILFLHIQIYMNAPLGTIHILRNHIFRILGPPLTQGHFTQNFPTFPNPIVNLDLRMKTDPELF